MRGQQFILNYASTPFCNKIILITSSCGKFFEAVILFDIRRQVFLKWSVCPKNKHNNYYGRGVHSQLLTNNAAR